MAANTSPGEMVPCPPPRRDTRPPSLLLPDLACDTHAHVLGPADRFPFDEHRIYTPPDSTVEDYTALLSTLGISRAVVVQPSVYGDDNAALVDALAAMGSGVRGVAVVGEDVSAAELKRLDDAGVRGIRFNVVDRREGRNVIPTDVLADFAKRIADFGWHIELLVNADEAANAMTALKDLPVDIVVAHLGYPRSGATPWMDQDGFAAFLSAFQAGRLWVKLTGPYRISGAPDLPYTDVTSLARRLVAENPDRILWGTDWPHVMMKKPMPRDERLVDLLTAWVPDADIRTRILVDNPAKLYGFAGNERLRGSP